MRVLFFEHRGCDFTSQLEEKLRTAGITVFFVHISAANDKEGFFTRAGRHQFLPMKSRLDLSAVRSLRHLMDEYRPDLIYCSTALSCFNSIVAQFPKKTYKLIFYRGAVRSPNWMSPSDILIFKSTWVDMFHCNCSAVAAALQEFGIGHHRLSVFPAIGYCLAQFEKEAPFPYIGARKAQHRVGVVANYRKIKGLEYLVDAMEMLAARGVDVELVVIGRDPRGALARYVRQTTIASRILLAGEVYPAWGAMKTFDCFVLPSLREGLSKAAIEALGCGVPVVATKVGGITEVITHARNGLLVQPANPAQLADAIQQVLTDKPLADKFRSEARRVFLEKFEASSVASKYVELFKQMAT